jgi:hypothetical protein
MVNFQRSGAGLEIAIEFRNLRSPERFYRRIPQEKNDPVKAKLTAFRRNHCPK